MTSHTDPYAEFREQPSAEQLGSLSNLVALAVEQEAKVAAAEEVLERESLRLKELIERDIPKVMELAGTKMYKTSSGVTVDLKDILTASIPKDKREAAHKWLDEHGHGGLIKRTVFVAFTREQQEEAGKLVKELAEDFTNVGVETKVEPSTLTAFAKEQKEAGSPLPDDVFSIYEAKKAKITPPKG
jgi:hypothetical protein